MRPDNKDKIMQNSDLQDKLVVLDELSKTYQRISSSSKDYGAQETLDLLLKCIQEVTYSAMDELED